MNFICKALEEAGGKKDLDRRINYLDFSYCYLERKVFELLMDSITVNNTLITLNLSHNNLGNGPGCRLCRVIQVHQNSYIVQFILKQCECCWKFA